MRFYDREQEIAFLRETRETAQRVARFTVVIGRRRIGKTTLIREAYKDEPFVYFFVARKAESDLCEHAARPLIVVLSSTNGTRRKA